MSTENLSGFFNPKIVAVVGASDRLEAVGASIFKNMLTDFKGKAYPINVKRDMVQGVKAYPSVAALPEVPDLVVVCTPSETVKAVVEESCKAGVKSMIIISAGFAEMGERGRQMLSEINEIRKQNGLRIVGPNCLGVISPRADLNATFAKASVPKGKMAFISQSGALGTAVLDWALSNNVGMSAFVSIGTMMDVDFGDLIEYFDSDPETEGIVMYIESITDAKEFIDAAKHFVKNKPLFAIKAGKAPEGAKAAASHTGALAGEDTLYDAAFKMSGVVRLDDSPEFLDVFQGAALQPLPKGNKLLILTNAGGPGVLATDFLIRKGGKLAQLSPETMEKLNKVLPPFWSRSNPVDVLGDAAADRYSAALDICMSDPNVDGVLVILTPQAMTEFEKTAEMVATKAKELSSHGKPVFGAWMGAGLVAEGRKLLLKGGIPSYEYPEDAVCAFVRMYEANLNKARMSVPEESYKFDAPDPSPIRAQLKQIATTGRKVLSEEESKSILSKYGIDTTLPILAKSPKDASRIAKQMGFPVVMKVQSEDISHKSDANCVMLNIRNENEAEQKFDEILKNAFTYKSDARIDGVAVQKMADDRGLELIIGSKKDKLFGTSIIFGMGGVAVELVKDTNICLAPLSRTSVKRLMEGTKIYSMLVKGFRNQLPADLAAIEETLIRFSRMAIDLPEIKEIDINPLRAHDKGCLVLDSRMILE